MVKRMLDRIGLTGYPKTTGGDGMHIYVPVEPIYTFEETRTFADLIARLAARQEPKLFTTPRTVAKRQKDRVYFDYLQNARSKTIAAPYVLRAYPGAPVATPLEWNEVRPRPSSLAIPPAQRARAVRRKRRPVRRRAARSRNGWKKRWRSWKRSGSNRAATKEGAKE